MTYVIVTTASTVTTASSSPLEVFRIRILRCTFAVLPRHSKSQRNASIAEAAIQ